MKTPQEIRKRNALKVLGHLYNQGCTTKVKSAKSTGLTLVTTNHIFNQLEHHVIEKHGIEKKQKGRNSSTYRFYANKNHLLGITVYIDGIGLRIENLQKQILHKEWISIKGSDQYLDVLEIIKDKWNRIQQQYDVVAMGVVIPGAYDEQKHKVSFSPNVKYLRDQNIQYDLEKITKVPTYVDKDVFAGVLTLDRAFYHKEVLVLISFVGGVGCAVLHKGTVMKGNRSMAGEIGHYPLYDTQDLCECGKKGCIETIALDGNILKHLELSSMSEMIELGIQKNEVVLDHLKNLCDHIQKIIEGVHYFYDPKTTVINNRWIAEIPEIHSYFSKICNDHSVKIIYQKDLYEEGSIFVAREKLLNDIKQNPLLEGESNETKD